MHQSLSNWISGSSVSSLPLAPYRLPQKKARDIVNTTPPFVKTVGVFANERHAKISKVRHYCGLDLVQLHGDESPAFCYDLMP